MNREKLQIIGQILTGKFQQEKPKAEKPKEKDVVGGFVDIFSKSLVNETSASGKLLKANQGWVFKNNDVIAKEVATIEFELFSVKTVGLDVVFTPIVSHKLLSVLDKFNEFTSASDGFYLTSSHKTLAGDSFWYVEGKAPNITGLFLLQPDKVSIKLGSPIPGEKIISGYQYKDTVKGKPVTIDYDTEEVIQFKNPNPENQYRGKSKVEAAAEAIDTDNYAIEANKSLFKRGLITNFILSTANKLTSDQRKALRAELRSSNQGINNANNVLLLSGGLEPKSVQLSNKDMEFIDQQKWLRDKIMVIFGNTPSSIGIVEDVNRANAESGILHWKRTTIKQEMKSITDTLNEFLVPMFGDNLVLGFKDPVPEDRTSKIDEVVKLRDAKVITTNEAREIVGLDPVSQPEADELNLVNNALSDVPKSVKNINYLKRLRKTDVFKTLQKNYDKQQIKEVARGIAKKIVSEKRKQTLKNNTVETPREHEAFTNDEVWSFHNKQITLVEANEDIFNNKVLQFIDGLIERAIENIPSELPETKNKALFDVEAETARAAIDFTPILMETSILAGTQALQFIDSDKVYVTTDIRNIVAQNVRKFTQSMISTDRDIIVDILAKGLSEGLSVPQIKRQVKEHFAEYSKTQAERITRSEVLRASNLATIDAWEQSGIVTAKQWLTAEDERVCPYCAPLNGKIVDIDRSFFKKGSEYFGDSDTPLDLSYSSIKGGNLHVNCRCTLLPVLINQKAFDTEAYETIIDREKASEERILELENTIDKRTKAFKELKKKYREEKADDQAYIKALEKFTDGQNTED